jgi:hypothetical protein
MAMRGHTPGEILAAKLSAHATHQVTSRGPILTRYNNDGNNQTMAGMLSGARAEERAAEEAAKDGPK